eukprot:CAMPEP_0174300514 /NCGR_PEP_ID=MMETSP0809-20121228/58502_1 /TAXON_ID=73025 ORGANISM="Eutreptiella gymnastica-like, Strain CCMP1594" /NCGR_SAMPLE_ID=MMETSP0809 /ASSEMBLY_ACC=CAM_ASM_000658 /LENGTH=152 /DNA_ID=CAMNT_0015406093 /DNA_START=23 /DNA_END=481 /DNA_ORIENTATION=+
MPSANRSKMHHRPVGFKDRGQARGLQRGAPPAGHDEAKIRRAEERMRHLRRDVEPSRRYGDLMGYYPYGALRAAFRGAAARIREEGEETAPQLTKSGRTWWDCGRDKCKVSRTWGPRAQTFAPIGLWEEEEGEGCSDAEDDTNGGAAIAHGA